MATSAQLVVLKAIVDLLEEKGYSPSMREVAKHVGVVVSSAWTHVRKLADLGLVEYDEHRYRTLRLTDAGRTALQGSN